MSGALAASGRNGTSYRSIYNLLNAIKNNKSQMHEKDVEWRIPPYRILHGGKEGEDLTSLVIITHRRGVMFCPSPNAFFLFNFLPPDRAAFGAIDDSLFVPPIRGDHSG